ncbi:MAG: hypothetical protein Q8N47_09770 [Bryobacterales bacterium]|nr:hypothetical protein [Bryobacterales bacterium]
MSSGSMYEEFRLAGDVVGDIGAALARFAESLSPGGQFGKENRAWIYRPNNFVAFQVQSKKGGILLTLRGLPVSYFKDLAEKAGLSDYFGVVAEKAGIGAVWMGLDRARSSYSTYPIRNAGQLLAAAQFIKWASEYRKFKASTSGSQPAARPPEPVRSDVAQSALRKLEAMRRAKATPSGNESITPTGGAGDR